MKTDWTAADYYNAQDLDRVEQKVRDIVTAMSGWIPQPVLSTLVGRDMTTLTFWDDLNRIEGNIQTLRGLIGTPAVWVAPKLTWVTLDAFDYRDANRLEQDLVSLENLLQNIKEYALRCGAFACGEATHGGV